MTTDKYRIFLSSGMEEFKEERLKIKDALDNFFSTFVYEEDAGARTRTIRDTYIKELINCDLYIGIFGLDYGKYTIDEFENARERKMDCLIYEKEIVEGETRDAELIDFLENISGIESAGGLTSCWFKNVDDLISKIERDLGRWVRSRDASTFSTTPEKPKLDISKKYFCDRVTQSVDFATYDKNAKFNFFIIDGAKKQSHVSLVKRFSIDKTACDNSKPPISINDIGNIERLKTHIRIELFRKFGISPIPPNQSFKSFVENIQHNGYQQVFIIFRIEEDLLFNKNIAKAIKWFSNEYCKEKSLPAGSPSFYFFLLIRYNETGTSKKKSIRRGLEKFKEYIKLDELDNVGFEHLRQWIEDHGIAETETSQENIIRSYFGDESYPMEIAEMHMAKLISDYNNENQELMDLMNKY